MAITKTEIKKYLGETLAVEVLPKLWQRSRRLPLYLRDGYTYYEIEILGERCLVMVDGDADRSAANIQKHLEQVRGKWEGEIIYARDQVTSLDRRRLIERKVPFMVPGNQMYLPMLGIDLREHFRQLRHEVITFSPATQAAILLLLTDPTPRTYDARELADRLGYSKMTASRILNELKSEDVHVIGFEGRARQLAFDGDRRALWQRAVPMLNSPVKHRHHIRPASDTSERQRFGMDAGLTALATYSMLAAPRIPTRAVTSEQWKTIEAQPNVTSAGATDPDAQEIEVWGYDPILFAHDATCDPFSLFLSLKGDDDERVQIAIE